MDNTLERILTKLDEIEKKVNKLIGDDTIYLSDYLNEWYTRYKKPYNGEESLKMISLYIRTIIEKYPNKKLIEVTTDNIQDILNEYTHKPNTQDKIYDVFNGSFDKALALGYIPYNPCKSAVKTPYNPKKKKPLSFEQQDTYYYKVHNKYQLLVFFACVTGIRIGRIMELTTDDIKGDYIEVLKKQRRGLTETYSVPILKELREQLPKSGKLFPNITYNSCKKWLEDFNEENNIKNVSLHCFRHTFCSTLYFVGCDLKQIQLWAGHSTFEMTSNVYTNILETGSSKVSKYLYDLNQKYGKIFRQN